MNVRKFFQRIPLFRIIVDYFYSKFRRFPGSLNYWEYRYSSGEDSGAGSRGGLAAYKADIINSILKENSIESVIEFGCGDGSQLFLIDYPKYIGLDVSTTAIEQCNQRFSSDTSKKFFITDQTHHHKHLNLPQFDLSISLDVIYHLAAAVGISQSMHRPIYFLQANSIGTANLYDILMKKPHIRKSIRSVIIPSSKTIYGEGTYNCTNCGIVYPQTRSKRVRIRL